MVHVIDEGDDARNEAHEDTLHQIKNIQVVYDVDADDQGRVSSTPQFPCARQKNPYEQCQTSQGKIERVGDTQLWFRQNKYKTSGQTKKHQRNDVSGGSGVGIGGLTFLGDDIDEKEDDDCVLLPSSSYATAASTHKPPPAEHPPSKKYKSAAKKSKSSAKKTTKKPAKKRWGNKWGNKSKGKGKKSYASSARKQPWSGRENGQGRYHGGNAQYMEISKQDPKLRGIGGATISF